MPPSRGAVTTKALAAFLSERQMTLSIAYARIGLSDYATLINNETVSDDHLGRIARLMGYTPERLAELCHAFTKS